MRIEIDLNYCTEYEYRFIYVIKRFYIQCVLKNATFRELFAHVLWWKDLYSL